MRNLLILALFLTCLAACKPSPVQHQEAYVFGTRVEVLVADADEQKGRNAIATVLREFDRLNTAYHAWKPSELTTLNQAMAAGNKHAVTPELAAFITDAQDLAKQGDYLFDPGIGRLIGIWGFQSDEFEPKIPAPATLAAWLQKKPSIADIEISNNVVSSHNTAVSLDFGGYLKGVALDRAAAVLKREGIDNALINIGGNVMALGSKQGRKWKVGIRHPRQPGPLAALELNDGEATGTSGDYQRFFELDGKRYPHLLDPRNAQPVTHTQSLTILIPAGKRSGTLSDALSKPIFIAGSDGWRNMARQLGVEHVLRVDASGKVQVTEKLRQRLETQEAMETIQ
ncbi:MAG: FAD:protein transferase [Proteobacteria bacterium]|nr:FAD:protein transferase [Pseudomonadota bacterium]